MTDQPDYPDYAEQQVAAINRFLDRLDALGVPMFGLTRGNVYPARWQQSKVENNAHERERGFNNAGLCAVFGGRVAVVDVDTKNGADPEAVLKSLEACGVTIYAEVVTPSGGSHFYVAAVPGMKTLHANEKRQSLDLTGTELIASGANTYLPGTFRAKYDGMGYTVVTDDLDKLLEDDGSALVKWVEKHKTEPNRKPKEKAKAADTGGQRPHARAAQPREETTPYGAKALEEWALDVASAAEGKRNDTLNQAAFRIGQLVPHDVTESDAEAFLLGAAEECGLPEREALSTVRSGLEAGRKNPRHTEQDELDLDGVFDVPDGIDPVTGECLDDTSEGDEGRGAGPSASPRRGEGNRARRLLVTRASDIKMRRVEWAWETESGGRFPVGELAIVAGQPGRGKSTKVNHLAALLTRGELPGKYYGRPRSVIVSATEESWETTIAPKMAALGADMTRVLRVEAMVYLSEAGRSVTVGLDLGTDMADLEDLMWDEDVAMIVLDPIISRLGKLDTHKDAEVRVALDPLVEVLHRTESVGVGIMHFNKGEGDPLKLLMGSTAFGAVARSVHVVERDPDAPGERLFATVKANMGRDDLPMVRFRLEEATVVTADGPATVAVAVDLGEDRTGRSFADVQQQLRRNAMSADRAASGVRTVIDEAVEFLANWMRSHGYSGKSSDIKAAAKEQDIPEMTLKRARAAMGIKVSARDGFGGGTYWTWSPELESAWQGEGS